MVARWQYIINCKTCQNINNLEIYIFIVVDYFCFTHSVQGWYPNHTYMSTTWRSCADIKETVKWNLTIGMCKDFTEMDKQRLSSQGINVNASQACLCEGYLCNGCPKLPQKPDLFDNICNNAANNETNNGNDNKLHCLSCNSYRNRNCIATIKDEIACPSSKFMISSYLMIFECKSVR